jgi:phosphopantothenoylcysteine decarboxylase / phosphopantothenate---cysteine ligase
MERPLDGRRIVLGITGGVSAYKAVELCRELVRLGAWVSPVLTRGAEKFVGAATFSAVASEPARTSLWQSPEPSPHTDLGRAADLVVVAPATANLLAAARAGTSMDLLTATLLATRAPLLLCPAMHTEMWDHPATRYNVAVLRERGATIVDPHHGELAGGDVGTGRLPDIAVIVEHVRSLLDAPGHAGSTGPHGTGGDLDGMHVLVSAGGTREPIDPVRYIGNRSSGRQGHAIALAARRRGATVTLVTTAGDDPRLQGADLDVRRVETAQQLHDAMLAAAPPARIVVMCAAVADFRPSAQSTTKLKRSRGTSSVAVEPTPNVLRALVDRRAAGQVVVGFAAETHDLHEHARAKLDASGADLIVANDVARTDAGFDQPTNAVTIHRAGHDATIDVPLCDKQLVAERVLDAALDQLQELRDQPPRLREVT